MSARPLTGTPLVARHITSPQVPEPPGASFSYALRVGDELLISGMTAGPGPQAAAMDAAAQTRACLRRIQALVEAAGGTVDNVLKLVVYLTDMAHKDAVNAVRREMFAPPYPASTLVGVQALVFPELVVEVDATIRLDARRGSLPAPDPDTP